MNNKLLKKDDTLNLSKALYELNNKNKIIFDIPGYNQWSTEGPFSKNINPHQFETGEILFYNDSSLLSIGSNWKRIKITCVRSGIIFFVYTRSPKKEYYLPIDCLAIQCGQIMPSVYIVDKLKFPKKYWDIRCDCPYTKIIYK